MWGVGGEGRCCGVIVRYILRFSAKGVRGVGGEGRWCGCVIFSVSCRQVEIVRLETGQAEMK